MESSVLCWVHYAASVCNAYIALAFIRILLCGLIDTWIDVCNNRTRYSSLGSQNSPKMLEMRQNHTIRSHVGAYEGSMHWTVHAHVSICSAYCYTFIGLDIIFPNRSQWIGHPQRILILRNFQVSHYEIINCVYAIDGVCACNFAEIFTKIR